MLPDPGLAAIVLAGGSSRRMGQAKAGLEWHGQTFLQRICATTGRVAGQTVVVGPHGKQLPPPEWHCPATVQWIPDKEPQAGPLVGLANGLAVLNPPVSRTLLLGCDSPLVNEPVLSRLVAELDQQPCERDGVVIADGAGRIALLSIWRVSIAGKLGELIGRGERRIQALLETCSCQVMTQATFAEETPELASFMNINTAEDYEQLLKIPCREQLDR